MSRTDAFAALIRKGRDRIVEIDRKEPADISIPVKDEDLEWLLRHSVALQEALLGFADAGPVWVPSPFTRVCPLARIPLDSENDPDDNDPPGMPSDDPEPDQRQSPRDIRHKLQKIRGLMAQDLETLLEEIWKFFSNWEEGCKQGITKLVAAVREEEKERCGQGPLSEAKVKSEDEIHRKILDQQGIALGILAQDLGPYHREVTCFSKQLDAAAKGWPGRLRAAAAVVMNIQEAHKFTLGQKMTVLVSHTVSAVLQVKGRQWFSPQRFLKSKAIKVEQDDVEIVVTNLVSPAPLVSGGTGEPVIHDCLETMEATYSSHPDLKDTPLEGTETWFTYGSSCVISGKRHAGYAVTTSREVRESGALPTNSSAQKAEIIALTWAFELAKEEGSFDYVFSPSHPITSSIACGSCIALYTCPAEDVSWSINRTGALLNTVLYPLLNPFICSLGNKSVVLALKKSIARPRTKLFP
ncbi:hypothetical protein HGM15179_020284 [Zosterops borbonicus]|uniref:RNase H type-1 domain-containing protein n=1 Tax=Zosterops borbonicus TaxID=364589 RepID=A0A8K1D9H6_9PASS|nr:hypothetical protein HGM15179_020284 [Zosterops borbonicus]